MKSRQIKYKQSNSWSNPEKFVRSHFDSVNHYNSEDSSLLEKISEYMKGRLDLEDVKADPALPYTEKMVSDMVADYHKKGIRNKDDEKFIRDNFHREIQENVILEEIKNIKLEIDKSDINEITSDWVDEWQERVQDNSGNDSKMEEIRDYIISSLQTGKGEPEIRVASKVKNGLRKYLINYISLSAAAIISVFILIKALIPSYNPEKLFNTYYEPMKVVLPVTRSYSTDESDNYSSGIESYKLGNYKHAAIDLSNALLKNTSAIEPRFFLGITHLELGNYDQAINFLTDVTNQPGEYRKDAEWYLGLVYLKTGEKEKAFSCFDFLAKAPGYYRERADKILRHLR